jgi:hypothetical protein
MCCFANFRIAWTLRLFIKLLYFLWMKIKNSIRINDNYYLVFSAIAVLLAMVLVFSVPVVIGYLLLFLFFFHFYKSPGRLFLRCRLRKLYGKVPSGRSPPLS